MSKIIEVDIIPNDAVVKISVSGEFYARVSAFITDFFPFKSMEHQMEVIEHVKKGTNPDDPFVYHLKTLLALQAHIEVEAKAQDLLKKANFNTSTGTIVD